MPPTERLQRQLAFLREVDKMKEIRRQTVLLNSRRPENDAEHSWHLCLMAVILEELSPAPIDLPRVLRMLLIHDLVEIDAGDTFAYDTEGARDKRQREEAAAERIFNILPADQAAEIRALWEEFEAMQTAEARFAAALDRFQPVMHNAFTGGHAWQRHGVPRDRVVARNAHIANGAPELWEVAREMIDSCFPETGDA